jgi:hypothetical protein
MERNAARVVCGKPGVQAGFAGTVARGSGTRPCRADLTAGKLGSRGGDHRHGIAETGLERGEVEPGSQG